MCSAGFSPHASVIMKTEQDILFPWRIYWRGYFYWNLGFCKSYAESEEETVVESFSLILSSPFRPQRGGEPTENMQRIPRELIIIVF